MYGKLRQNFINELWFVPESCVCKKRIFLDRRSPSSVTYSYGICIIVIWSYLSFEKLKLVSTHEAIKERRKLKKAKQERAKQVQAAKELAKREWVEKLGDITATVKAAGLCKRDVPSLNQVKLYLMLRRRYWLL